jgi:hypothetical protein
MSDTNQFGTVQAAKDYLVQLIGEEAARLNDPLSDVERAMLYFTEEGGLSESMRAVSEKFDREYDQYAYEEKIGFVVKSLQKRQTVEEREAWNDALTAMGDGDHYLFVLIDGAKGEGAVASLDRLSPWLPGTNSGGERPPGDWLRLILVACAVLGVALVVVLLSSLFRR